MPRLPAAGFLLIITAMLGCSSDQTAALSAIDPSAVGKIEVRFKDSSTPPQFHRSWAITVSDGTFDASVDSYGDPIATGTGTIADATISEFLDALVDLGPAPKDDEACTGGTSYYFAVLDASGAPIYETFSPPGCGDKARAWNSDAGSVARILSSAADLGPLYAEVDAAFAEE